MFEKLLFERASVALDLAELFEDAGKTYLEIAQDIAKYYDLSDSMLNNILKPES